MQRSGLAFTQTVSGGGSDWRFLSALSKEHQLGLWAATPFLSGQTRWNEVSELSNSPIKLIRRHPPPSCGLLERRSPRTGRRNLFPLSSGVRAPPVGLPVNHGNFSVKFSSVQFSLVQLCDPMNCRTPGLPVHHQLLEPTQTHVHWVGDGIQPSHPLLSPSSLALNQSQHQGLLDESAFHIRWPKHWSFSFNISPPDEHPGLISFRMNWLYLLSV